MSEERIQKILARAGFGSRRSCETLISSGRVQVNQRKVVLGAKADATMDTIAVDGKIIPKEEKTVYIALHKPRGVLSDMDPNDSRSTVRDLVDIPGHLFCVGRLDLDSEGLILMTNDGDLANHLTHPRYGHEKEYRVLVFVRPDDEQLATWRRGVVMEDGYRTAPAQVEIIESAGKGAWLKIVMNEGKKRQIREVGKRIGVPVARIIRLRIGTLLLGSLKPAEWRYLTMAEIASLKMTTSVRAASSRPRTQRASRLGGPPLPRRSDAPRSPRPDEGARAPHPGGNRPDDSARGTRTGAAPAYRSDDSARGPRTGSTRSDDGVRPSRTDGTSSSRSDEGPRARRTGGTCSGDSLRTPRPGGARSGDTRPPRAGTGRAGVGRPSHTDPNRPARPSSRPGKKSQG